MAGKMERIFCSCCCSGSFTNFRETLTAVFDERAGLDNFRASSDLKDLEYTLNAVFWETPVLLQRVFGVLRVEVSPDEMSEIVLLDTGRPSISAGSGPNK